jgi:hypothetical protein
VNLAALIATQRAEHGIPHAVSAARSGYLRRGLTSGGTVTGRCAGNVGKRLHGSGHRGRMPALRAGRGPESDDYVMKSVDAVIPNGTYAYTSSIATDWHVPKNRPRPMPNCSTSSARSRMIAR